jgi:hypothetical protein
MKPPNEKPKAAEKKIISDYLVTVGGLSRGDANRLANTTNPNATHLTVANDVKKGLKL